MENPLKSVIEISKFLFDLSPFQSSDHRLKKAIHLLNLYMIKKCI